MNNRKDTGFVLNSASSMAGKTLINHRGITKTRKIKSSPFQRLFLGVHDGKV
jgi:hypothetical protein